MYFVFLHARMKKILTHAALGVAFKKDITLVQFSCSVMSESVQPQRVGHDWATELLTNASC